MLTAARDELLTRVGPGTPMGELLRRYWQPVAGASELDSNPVKPLRRRVESHRHKAGNLPARRNKSG